MMSKARDLRKPTGGRFKPYRGKRKREHGGYPVETTLASEEYRVLSRTRGGGLKVRLKSAVYINLSDPLEGVVRKVKILQALKNPAGVDYTRRGIVTKGALVKTEVGVAKVTSRPSQDGVVNGVLVETWLLNANF